MNELKETSTSGIKEEVSVISMLRFADIVVLRVSRKKNRKCVKD